MDKLSTMDYVEDHPPQGLHIYMAILSSEAHRVTLQKQATDIQEILQEFHDFQVTEISLQEDDLTILNKGGEDKEEEMAMKKVQKQKFWQQFHQENYQVLVRGVFLKCQVG